MNNFGDNFIFFLFLLVKDNEEKKRRERIRTSCEYERKTYNKIVVQILFILTKLCGEGL